MQHLNHQLSSVRVTSIVLKYNKVGVYTKIASIGRTSMVVHVEAWVRRERIGLREKVTEGNFKFVAIDESGSPTPIPDEKDLPDYALPGYEM